MPRPLAFSERKSSSMMTTGKRNFMRSSSSWAGGAPGNASKWNGGRAFGQGAAPEWADCAPAAKQARGFDARWRRKCRGERRGRNSRLRRALRLDVREDERARPGQEAEAERRAQVPAPAQVLLRRHDR